MRGENSGRDDLNEPTKADLVDRIEVREFRKESLALLEPNHCGDCRACCTVLGVKALRKSDYEPCKHECGSGCSIYASRPKECATYQCMWLDSGLPEYYRPEQIGVILEAQETPPIGNAVLVREVWLNAWDSPEVKSYVGEMCQLLDAYAYLIRFDGTRKAVFPFGKEHLASQFNEFQIRYQCFDTTKTVRNSSSVDKKAKRKQAEASKKRNRKR